MKLKSAIVAFLSGLINNLMGSGGGLLAVPYFCSTLHSQHKAQANSTALILPLCILNTFLYRKQIELPFKRVLLFIIPGIIGAAIGGLYFKKLPTKVLKLLLGAFMIYCGMKMILSVH